MAKLIYLAITSLDGSIEDDEGGFGWAKPDAEVQAADRDISVRGPGLAEHARQHRLR